MKKKNSSRILFILLCLSLCFTTLRFSSTHIYAEEQLTSTNEELEGIKNRFKETIIGSESTNSSPLVTGKISAIQAKAIAAKNAYIPIENRDTSLFNGVDLSATNTVDRDNSDPLGTTAQRIYEMAQGYATIGSTTYHDEELKHVLLESIDWFYTNSFSLYEDYKPGELLFGNWYNWEIGIPTNLTSTFTLIEDELNEEDPNLIPSYVRLFDNYLRNGKNGDVDLTARQHTGTNLADITTNRILQGALTNDENRIKIAVSNLMTVFDKIDLDNIVNNNTDGVYDDGSFIQHHRVAYTGTYGAILLKRAIQAVILLDTTQWQPNDQLSVMQDWIYNSFSPLMYNGYMMEIVKGRGVSRSITGYQDSTSVIEAMVALSTYLKPDEKIKLQSHIKFLANSMPTPIDPSTLKISNIVNFQNILDDDNIPSVSQTQIKHYAFNAMDKNVQLKEDYAFAISRSSNRIAKYEYMSGENLKSWFQGDGMFYIYQNGRDENASYGSSYFATVDPYRLPGTTVPNEERQTILEAYGGYYYPAFAAGSSEQNDYVYFPVGTNTYSGSTVLDGYALAGMQLGDDNAYVAKQQGILGDDFVTAYKNVDANKSWFMFDDEIVVVTSGIHDEEHRSVTSTIDNQMSNIDETISVAAQTKNGDDLTSEQLKSGTLDLSWLSYQTDKNGTQIGYYFPEENEVSVKEEIRDGNLKDNRDPSPSTPLQNQFYTMTYEHGVDPQDDSYSYVILPNSSKEDTQSYAENPNISILANTNDVHAVKQNELGLIGFNFFSTNETEVNSISVAQPASILLKDNGNENYTLSVSDPTNSQDSVRVRFLNKKIVSTTDSTVTYNEGDTYTDIIIPTSGLHGKSVVTSFTLEEFPQTPLEPGEPEQPVTPAVPETPDSNDSNVGTGVSTNNANIYLVAVLISAGLLATTITYKLKKKS